MAGGDRGAGQPATRAADEYAGIEYGGLQVEVPDVECSETPPRNQALTTVALENHAVRACMAALGIQRLSRMAATVFGRAPRSGRVVASGGQLGAVGAVGVRARRVLIQPAAQ
jgi:hypothetical protein